MSLRQPEFESDPLEAIVTRLLQELGEDTKREGLLETPARVARAYRDLTDGYQQSAAEVIGEAVFSQQYDEMVVVRAIPFFSLCEHHLLPFFGHVHFGYLPNGKVVGLSKIPRVVEVFSRRLQIQEGLTREVAEAFQEVLQPHGVGVVMEARHLCMEMRGVEKAGSVTVTSCMLGGFRDDPRTRAEFLELIRTQS